MNITTLFFCIFITVILSYITVNKVISENKNLLLSNKPKIYNKKNSMIPDDFFHLHINITEGPITVDRSKDDGTKQNLYNGSIKLTEEEKENERRIAIVMFSNLTKVNTIHENAVSEMYQYSNIYGYPFKFNTINYNKDKSIYYMKLSVLLEALIEGMKEKTYDWIFWIDSDITISNPTIRLEAFLPIDKNINFIAAADSNGLNDGVFFIKVNSWSYNFLINALSYADYNKGKKMRFEEQTALNNILCENQEEKHYVLVPEHWFNTYFRGRTPGDFIVHQAGGKDKNENAKMFREEISKDDRWHTAKTNEMMRDEVLKYYKLPKTSQTSNGKITC